MRKAPYTGDPLSQLKMSWLLRQRLRRVRERQRTGLLMQGIIRTPSRSMSSKNPAVSIREGDAWLGMVTLSLQIPKWVPLEPGAQADVPCLPPRLQQLLYKDDRPGAW